jgi:hypothetical protein
METLMKHDDTNATNAAAGLSISFTEKTPLVSNVNQFGLQFLTSFKLRITHLSGNTHHI